jgi:hypothetical protein
MARADREVLAFSTAVARRRDLRLPVTWQEPQTQAVYPLAFEPYRKIREREERWPPRHERLGYQVDHWQWEQWTSRGASEVVLEVRAGAPPRIQRMIGRVLRSIRYGRSAERAISNASRQLRVPPSCVRAWIAAHVQYRRVAADLAP